MLHDDTTRSVGHTVGEVAKVLAVSIEVDNAREPVESVLMEPIRGLEIEREILELFRAC